jgi:LysM repeat protein/uncharacterized protein YfaT (DUF1175 family)
MKGTKLFITHALIVFMGTSIFNLSANAAVKYNSSDVIKYALTSHGIRYLLRDKRGSVNAWKVGEKNLSKISTSGRHVPSKRWGNTDCSGLVSAAYRYKGYSHPTRRGKPSLSTWYIGDSAKKKRANLSIVASGSKMRRNAKHGDLLNRTGKPYGHVYIFNGENSKGLIESVEARCTKCGVGQFYRNWNQAVKTRYKLVRSSEVRNNIKSKRTVIHRREAQAVRSTLGKSYRPSKKERSSTTARNNSKPARSNGSYRVRSGDTGARIAKRQGLSWNSLKRANPGVRWNRLKIGQKLNLPGATSISTTRSRTSVHTVRRGDSLWKISKRYGVSINRITKTNSGLRRNSVLRVGQSLNIPN